MYYSAYGGICQAIFPKNGDSLSEKMRKRLYTFRGIVYNSRKALRLVAAARKRLFGLTDENLRLRARIEELRLIDRAKCTLISVLNISEKEAHRTIEKQAMDLRLTKKQVAEHILRTYDNE